MLAVVDSNLEVEEYLENLALDLVAKFDKANQFGFVVNVGTEVLVFVVEPKYEIHNQELLQKILTNGVVDWTKVKALPDPTSQHNEVKKQAQELNRLINGYLTKPVKLLADDTFVTQLGQIQKLDYNQIILNSL